MEPRPDLRLDACALAWRVEGRDEQGLAGAEPELAYLLRALGRPVEGAGPGVPEFVPGLPIRAGYRLVAETGKKPERLPVFAQALASGLATTELVRLFDHLWGVDVAVWRRLATASPAELAERWLTSPGRRLVRDPAILVALREGQERVDATDLRLETCYAAAGADEALVGEPRGAERWLDLHGSIPGELLAAWAPKRSDRDVAVGLARLERGSPCSLRGAALGWLLSRTVDRPQVDLDGVRHDLREALPARLAIALATEEGAEDFAAPLEEVLLQHAAGIVARDPAPGALRRGWHLARWIHGCLVRSPFAPGAEDRLYAELTALLPAKAATVDRDDPLHPARFGAGGVPIADLALVAGAWAHYGREGERLLPPPSPLVGALRRVAGRALRAGEWEAERSLARGVSNELGWSAPHVAPPWLARRLLTEWRVPWLWQLGDEVAGECLRVLPDEPRFHWLAHVVRAEGLELGEATRSLVHSVWRELATRARPEIAASLAIGVLAELDADEVDVALASIERAEPGWRPFLFDAWVGAAQAGSSQAAAALAGLLGLARSGENPAELRLNAALLLLRRVAPGRGTPEGAAYLAHLRELAQGSPFRDHPGLMRELRRLSGSLR